MTIDKIHLKKLLQLISYFMMKGWLHPPNTANKVRCPLSQFLFNNSTEISSHYNKARKRNKGHVDCKKEIKGSLFADAVTAYIETSRHLPKEKRKPSTTNRWGQQGIRKQNEPTRKNKSQFYIKNEHVVNIKNTISGVFTIAPKKIKCSNINTAK